MIWVWVPLLFWSGQAPSGCAVIRGDKILARDLVHAAPKFAAADPETALGLAPFPGIQRTFSGSDLERLLRLAKIEPAGALAPLCVERYRRSLEPEALMEALRSALDDERASIVLEDYDHSPFPEGELEFRRSALPPTGVSGKALLWRGHLRFEAGRTVPVWVSVRIQAKRRVIVANRQLEPGQRIGDGASAELREMPPRARDTTLTLDEARVMAPRRAVASGAALSRAMLFRPQDVRPGESVALRSCYGAACVTLDATASSGGIAGQTIRVRSPLSRRLVTARITGPGQVTVDAGGKQIVEGETSR